MPNKSTVLLFAMLIGSQAFASSIVVQGTNSAALQTAISQSKASPGSCVLIAAGSVIHIDANVVIDFNNACLVGEGNTSVLVADGGTILVKGPQTSGFCYGFIGNEGDTSISYSSSCGFQPGQYLLIGDISLQGPPEQVTQISGVSGGTLNLSTALAFNVVSSMRIQAIDMLSGIKIGNFAIVEGTATYLQKPLSATDVTDSEFYNLMVTGLPAVGIKADTGYRNRFHDMTFHSVGTSPANGDFQMFRQTGAQISNIESYDATGFGPELISVQFSNINNLQSVHSVGRGFKLLGSNYNTLTGITVSNCGVAGGYTGILVQTSNRNTLSQCQSIHNARGIDLEIGSSYNRISNCIVRFNIVDDIEANGSLYNPPSSNYNSFTNVEYVVKYDSGVGNTFNP
jgi:parallel beta-helix repeat protein